MEVKSAQQPEPPPPGHGGAPAPRGGGARTFPDLLDRYVRTHGERIFLPRRRARVVEPVTFRRMLSDVELVAAGLMALGLQRGDRIGLLADNRYEWLLADLGTTWFGGVDVPRGSDTPPSEIEFILRHSGCRAVFTDDDKLAAMVSARRGALPMLEHIVVLAQHASTPGAIGLGTLMERGRAFLQAGPGRVQMAAAAVRPDDLLTIVYTSGTTADPKGVMLTHSNVLANVTAVTDVLHINANDMFLSVLPAWHMYERIMDYLALAAGGQLVYTDRRHIKEDLQQVAPTVFAAVPRIWETIHDGLVAHAAKMPGWRGKAMRRALLLCRESGSGRATLGQRLQLRLLRPVVRRLQAITGGRLRLAVSGGGSLPRHVDETLLGIGLPLLNGYGLTETSPVASVRLPERNCAGTIGPPLPGTQIQARNHGTGAVMPASETGVLWIRGPQVMRGYYENPQKTAEVLDRDGWFNSGDLGHVDSEGRVWITGRQKDTIVLAGGENVEPEPIETAVKTSPYIEQIVCLGQDQKTVGALIVPALDLLEQAVPRKYWDERGGLLNGKAVADLLRRELDRLVHRDNFRSCDRIGTFRVLTEALTMENGLLTPTLKVRRHVVQQRFAAAIAAMFS